MRSSFDWAEVLEILGKCPLHLVQPDWFVSSLQKGNGARG